MSNQSFTLHIYDDSAAFNQAAAQLLVMLGKEAVAEHGRFSLALCGGGTPTGVYELLAEHPFCQQMPWQQTHLFWGDERLVPPDDPDSNYGQANELMIKKVPVPADNVHRVHGELDMETAVADYTHQLQNFTSDGKIPTLDVVLLGMGSDGHTASLFPGSPVQQAEWVVGVTADYDGRPAQRLSLTPKVINSARHVIFLVTGQSKAKTLQRVLYGPYQPVKLPAQRIQPSKGTLTWLTDTAAAQELSQLTKPS